MRVEGSELVPVTSWTFEEMSDDANVHKLDRIA